MAEESMKSSNIIWLLLLAGGAYLFFMRNKKRKTAMKQMAQTGAKGGGGGPAGSGGGGFPTGPTDASTLETIVTPSQSGDINITVDTDDQNDEEEVAPSLPGGPIHDSSLIPPDMDAADLEPSSDDLAQQTHGGGVDTSQADQHSETAPVADTSPVQLKLFYFGLTVL